MFPFLAPIRQPAFRYRMELTPERRIEIVFMADTPHVSRRPSEQICQDLEGADSQVLKKTAKQKSPVKRLNLAPSSSSSRSDSTSPRPKSRTSPREGLSQPSSARSAKSSPVPPAIPERVPPPTRYRNKGLETSSQMMELFGGGSASAFGPGSSFQKIPDHAAVGKAAVLEKESEALAQWEKTMAPPPNAGPFFSSVEDHDKAYERAAKRAQRKSGDSPFERVMAQREDEYQENQIVPDDTGELAEPDPTCPATQYLEALRLQEEQAISQHTDSFYEPATSRSEEEYVPKLQLSPIEEMESPESTSDWRDAKENVLSTEERPLMPCEPGPDLEQNEEVIELDEEGRVLQKRPERRTSGDSRESSGGEAQSDIAEEAAADEQERPESPATTSDGGMALLIRGAQVVNDDSVFTADVLVQDGTITQVAPNIEAPKDATVLEATGRMLLPAGIDIHTNFSLPDSVDDFKTGGRAAVAGGTATVIELVNPKEGESLSAAIQRTKTALCGALCNVGLSVRVREWNDSVKKEMENSVVEFGVNSFVLDLDGDDQLYQALDHCKNLGAHARVLPENGSIVAQLERKMLELGITGPEGFLQSRPEELEKERVSSLCLLSQITNCPISILSLTSAETASAIATGRERGALAHAEIATAAVGSDGSHYFNKCLQHASAHMTETPLRTEGNNANRLLQTLASSPLCVCASGHHAVSSSSRAGRDFTQMPRGVAAVEERMSVLWEKGVRSGKIDPMRFVAVTSTNAAKIFNLYPKKGRIAIGADADLVLWDPIVKRKLTVSEGVSSADTSVFEGLTVHGGASVTIVGGQLAWKDGSAGDAAGTFLPLAPNSPYLFSVVQMREKTTSFEKVERADSVPTSNGTSKQRYDNPFDNTPIRPTQRKHNESSISFGDERPQPATRVRNPPGGRSTGFW